MKKTFSELAFKRLLQIFIVFCCIGFPLEIMPNKILFSLTAGIVLIYIIDIIYDVKTLNKRLDNVVVVSNEIEEGGRKYELRYIQKMGDTEDITFKNASSNASITRIFKSGGIQYIAFYGETAQK